MTVIEKYIKEQSNVVEQTLLTIHNYIITAVCNIEQTFNYGIPTYKLNNKNLFHFAVYKTHIGFYPGPQAIEVFKEELKEYECSKGTVKVKLEQKVPFDTIYKMINHNITIINKTKK